MAEGAEDFDFSTTDAGASLTYPSEAGQLKRGGFVVIKGHPCKVVDLSTSKTGKHGHAKANITAIDIFTGKKYEDVVPTTHNVDVPNVARKEYSLLDITSDGYLSLMDPATGAPKEDLRLPDYPENLANEITNKFNEGAFLLVQVLVSMGHEQIVSFKEDTNS